MFFMFSRNRSRKKNGGTCHWVVNEKERVWGGVTAKRFPLNCFGARKIGTAEKKNRVKGGNCRFGRRSPLGNGHSGGGWGGGQTREEGSELQRRWE